MKLRTRAPDRGTTPSDQVIDQCAEGLRTDLEHLLSDSQRERFRNMVKRTLQQDFVEGLEPSDDPRTE
jgi:hypothetical protein